MANATRIGSRTLPPGQRKVEGFPRFGTHLHKPPPAVPDNPTLEIGGPALTAATTMPLTDLDALPRTQITADFHCVAGWSATDLSWEGVSFATFYREVLEPRVATGASVTHLVFRALDGYDCVVCIEDLLGEDVLLADLLDGRPLTGSHGAPLRLVSPGQYGFVNVKHLCAIEAHKQAPDENFGAASGLVRLAFRLPLFRRHPHARVWQEERHRYLSGRALRPVYRALTPSIRKLSARRAGRRPLR